MKSRNPRPYHSNELSEMTRLIDKREIGFTSYWFIFYFIYDTIINGRV